MKHASIRLSVKALGLVALLLLCESLFVGSYLWLLRRAEEDTARQERAKAIVAKTNDLLESLYAAGDNIQKNVFHKEQADLNKYELAKKEVPVEIAWLKEHLQNDAEQLELLNRIEKRTGIALKMLAKMKHVSETEPQMVAYQYAVGLRPKVQKTMEGLVRDLIEFLNTEKKIEKEIPAVLKQQRSDLRTLLVVALVLNVLAAIGLVILFTRSITSRLNVVVENSHSLKRRAPLKPPLKGDDEIAQLDRAFHHMSASLRGEEELVKASETQLRAIIDQMPIGLTIIKNDGTIDYANPTLEHILGYQIGDLVGAQISDRLGMSSQAAWLVNNTAGGATELLVRRQDGSEVNVEFSVVETPFLDNLSRLAIVIDVTERHAVEKLKQAFVAMVSHDLRTPLTSVAGFLQLLPMGVYGQLNSLALSEAESAEQQVEQLIMLINDLLDLEKLQAGKLDFVKTPCALEDIIDAALDTVYGLAEQRQISVIFEGCEVEVLADGDRLRQSLQKVMNSLLRACTAGETIDICAIKAPNRSTSEIQVHAHRLTLSDDQLVRLFEPFQRFDLPHLSGSLGLGLTLARAIVLQHGGAVSARCAAETGGTIVTDMATSGTAGGIILSLSLPV